MRTRWRPVAGTVLGVASASLLAAATGGAARWRWAGQADLRLITSQYAHLGTAHLAANLVGLCLLGVVGLRLTPGWQFARALAATQLSVACGLLLPGAPAWYVGLSGSLYGVFLLFCLMLTCSSERLLGWLLSGVLVIKTAVDLGADKHWDNWLGIPLAPAAHAWGMLGGLAYFGVWHRFSRPTEAALR